MGVSVREISTDMTMVRVTVTANSRKSRTMMPPINRSGMNTATSETEIEMMVKLTSLEPCSAASCGDMPRSTCR